MTVREFARSFGSSVLQRVGRAASRVQESKPLSSDLLESDDAYLVVFDAPGATQSDVQVRYTDGRVMVRIDRFRDYFEGYEMLFPGRGLALDGSVALPDDAMVSPHDSTATLTDAGVLEIVVPKQSPEPASKAPESGTDSEQTPDV